MNNDSNPGVFASNPVATGGVITSTAVSLVQLLALVFHWSIEITASATIVVSNLVGLAAYLVVRGKITPDVLLHQLADALAAEAAPAEAPAEVVAEAPPAAP
jgi:hypothetical protein